MDKKLRLTGLKRSRGNSMLEYVIPAVVVIAVAIPAGAMLTDGLPSMFSGAINGSLNGSTIQGKALGSDAVKLAMAKQQQSSTTTESPQPQTELASTQPTPEPEPKAEPKPAPAPKVNLSTFSSVPSNKDLAELIETAGANGTLKTLASTIEQMAQELLASGEITKAEASEFAALANQGHRIAYLESLVEDLAKQSGGDNKTFQNMTVKVDGKTLTTIELDDLLKGGGAETKALREMRKALGPQLRDRPEIKKLLTGYTEAIYEVSSNVSRASHDMLWGTDGAVASTDYLNSQVASNLTHGNSTSICKTGKGKDNGNKCQ